MANTQAPNGFQEWQHMDGSAPTGGQGATPFKIAYNNTTAIGYGDPVIQISTGYIGRAASATAVAILGVFLGCKYLSTANNQMTISRYWPGTGILSTNDVQAWVITDPNKLWRVQTFNTAITFANIGEGVNIQIGTVNTTTGFSGASADQSTLNTTNTLPFKVYGLLSQFYTASGAENGTDDASAYNTIIVQGNNWVRKQLESAA